VSARLNPPSLKKRVLVLLEKGLYLIHIAIGSEESSIITFEDEDGTIRKKLSQKTFERLTFIGGSVAAGLFLLLFVFFLSLLKVEMRFNGQ
jgi:uncharacterized membrane protein YciS (DUF1049 family)